MKCAVREIKIKVT